MNQIEVDKEAKIEELRQRIVVLKNEVDYYNALQMSRKDAINGAYGAFANPHFCFFNNDIASTITSFGRNLIQWMDYKNERYWYEVWHIDTHLHKILKNEKLISQDAIIKPIDPSYKDANGAIYILTDRSGTKYQSKADYEKLWFMSLDKLEIWAASEEDQKLKSIYQEVVDMKHNKITRKVPVSIYSDTDSLFSSFHPAMISCNFDSSDTLKCKEFISVINKHRIQPYFKNVLDKYAEVYGVENIEDFELERIDKSVIFLEKKHYIQNIVFEDGIHYDELSYLYSKGIEIVKSSTPLFAREHVMGIIKYLFSNPDTFNIKSLMEHVKNLKKSFIVSDIESISMQTSMNNYEAKVLNDKDRLEFVTGAHFSVKAAAYHNFLLNQNSNLITKYEPIKSGNKIKYYYTKDKRYNDIFAFSRGAYPKEYAPEIDMDLQFEKTILNIVNRFGNVLGLPTINKRLSVIMPLFN